MCQFPANEDHEMCQFLLIKIMKCASFLLIKIMKCATSTLTFLQVQIMKYATSTSSFLPIKIMKCATPNSSFLQVQIRIQASSYNFILLKSIWYSCEQQRLWQDCAPAQSYQSLYCSHSQSRRVVEYTGQTLGSSPTR